MRLSHVTLFVAEIGRSREFYRALGMRLIVDSPHYCRFSARVDEQGGDETLSIERHDGPIVPACQIGLEFATAAALDAYVAGLGARGVAVAEGPVDRSWRWRDARVFDPDGHELMLFHAGEDKLNPPWRVKA